MVLIDALVLMFLTKFVPNSTLRRSCLAKKNIYDAKFASNKIKICSAPLQKICANKVP